MLETLRTAPKTKRSAPFVWVTWLAKLMAGEQHCVWATWFRAHYQGYVKAPQTFSFAQWQMNHARFVNEEVGKSDRCKFHVTTEDQNWFRYRTPAGILVAGKPDLLMISIDEPHRGMVCDLKTGQPKLSDRVQVMIYMYLLPRCRQDIKGRTMSGLLRYSNDREAIVIPEDAIDSGFVRNFDYWLDRVTASAAPCATPSCSECRFCDITIVDCPDRIESHHPA